jgi:hypothetical protein
MSDLKSEHQTLKDSGAHSLHVHREIQARIWCGTEGPYLRMLVQSHPAMFDESTSGDAFFSYEE